VGANRILPVVALLAAGCGGSGEKTADAGSTRGVVRASEPPAVDPAAGAPRYLALAADRHLLLDDAGRVARVLPKAITTEASPCPGARRFAEAGSWSGEVSVRRLDGRPVWRRPVRATELNALACLDRAGRRVAWVRADDRDRGRHAYGVHNLVIVSRAGSRHVRSYRGETTAIDARRLYVSDDRGVVVHRMPSGTPLRRIRGVVAVHRVVPAPDHRRAVLTAMPRTTDVHHLADLRRGTTRRLRIPRARIVGWLSSRRLVVRADRTLRVLDPRLGEVARVEGFRPENPIVDGDQVVALDGSALVAVKPGAGPPRTLGTVPPGTSLVAAI
jgi:hypothetical protein